MLATPKKQDLLKKPRSAYKGVEARRKKSVKQAPPVRFLDMTAEIKPLIRKIKITTGIVGTIVTFIAARPGEGTSTAARSFAHAFNEETGKKTLLILTGHDSQQMPGIVECVLSDTDISEALIEETPGVWVGRWADGNSDKNAAGRVVLDKAFWKTLSKNFALIVVDAPALQLSTDGIAFAQASAQTVIVVEAEATRREVVENLYRTLAAANAKIAGFVMNKRRFHIPEGLYRRI